MYLYYSLEQKMEQKRILSMNVHEEGKAEELRSLSPEGTKRQEMNFGEWILLYFCNIRCPCFCSDAFGRS